MEENNGVLIVAVNKNDERTSVTSLFAGLIFVAAFVIGYCVKKKRS